MGPWKRLDLAGDQHHIRSDSTVGSAVADLLAAWLFSVLPALYSCTRAFCSANMAAEVDTDKGVVSSGWGSRIETRSFVLGSPDSGVQEGALGSASTPPNQALKTLPSPAVFQAAGMNLCPDVAVAHMDGQ